MSTALPQQLHRHLTGTAVHDGRGTAETVDDRAQTVSDLSAVDRAQPPVPGLRGETPFEHGWEARFVDLHDELGPRHEPPHVRDVRGHPVRERAGDVPPRARVGHGELAAGELDARGERPRAGHLQLERTGPPVVGLGELIEVLAEEGAGPPFVPSRSTDEAPAVGLGLDVEVGEHRGRPADHVGAGAAGRELGQVRDAVAEEVAHGDDRLARAFARPGAEAGGGGHEATDAARPARRIVPDPTTRVPS